MSTISDILSDRVPQVPTELEEVSIDTLAWVIERYMQHPEITVGQLIDHMWELCPDAKTKPLGVHT